MCYFPVHLVHFFRTVYNCDMSSSSENVTPYICTYICLQTPVCQSNLVKYASNMLQVCSKYTASLPEVCFKYDLSMLQVCFKFAWSVLKVCSKHASSMLQEYFKYASSMPEACLKYGSRRFHHSIIFLVDRLSSYVSLKWLLVVSRDQNVFEKSGYAGQEMVTFVWYGQLVKKGYRNKAINVTIVW